MEENSGETAVCLEQDENGSQTLEEADEVQIDKSEHEVSNVVAYGAVATFSVMVLGGAACALVLVFTTIPAFGVFINGFFDTLGIVTFLAVLFFLFTAKNY